MQNCDTEWRHDIARLCPEIAADCTPCKENVHLFRTRISNLLPNIQPFTDQINRESSSSVSWMRFSHPIIF